MCKIILKVKYIYLYIIYKAAAAVKAGCERCAGAKQNGGFRGGIGGENRGRVGGSAASTLLPIVTLPNITWVSILDTSCIHSVYKRCILHFRKSRAWLFPLPVFGSRAGILGVFF